MTPYILHNTFHATQTEVNSQFKLKLIADINLQVVFQKQHWFICLVMKTKVLYKQLYAC